MTIWRRLWIETNLTELTFTFELSQLPNRMFCTTNCWSPGTIHTFLQLILSKAFFSLTAVAPDPNARRLRLPFWRRYPILPTTVCYIATLCSIVWKMVGLQCSNHDGRNTREPYYQSSICRPNQYEYKCDAAHGVANFEGSILLSMNDKKYGMRLRL